jgi:hypothetical protein
MATPMYPFDTLIDMIADFDLFQSRSDATLDGCTTSWDNFVDAMRKFVRINVCGQG